MTTQITSLVSQNNNTNELKFKKVAFLGGAAWTEEEQPYKDAFDVAKILAENGYEILNGGGPGVMRASTKGAQAGKGKSLIITYHPHKTKRHYEGTDPLNNADDEIYTLDYFDRTKVLLQNTNVHIIFRGSLGTLSEFGMSWISSWIHEPNNKPIIMYGDFWNEILDVLVKHLKIQNDERNMLKVLSTPQEVLEYLTELEDYFKPNSTK